MSPRIRSIVSCLFFLACVGSGCPSNTIANHSENQSDKSSKTPSTIDQLILTPEDFNGQSASKDGLHPRQSKETFHVQLTPNLPIYTFHIVSSSPNGFIEVFRAPETNIPLQKIQLDPNRWLIDDAPIFFTMADINFDGYPDIGSLVDGGAKWRAYEYWVFDEKTGKFISAPVTEDMRNISFNHISFDKERAQIITENFIGGITGGAKTVYQFQYGRLLIKKEYRQQNISAEESYYTTGSAPSIHCEIEINTYVSGKKTDTIKKELPHECISLPEIF